MLLVRITLILTLVGCLMAWWLIPDLWAQGFFVGLATAGILTAVAYERLVLPVGQQALKGPIVSGQVSQPTPRDRSIVAGRDVHVHQPPDGP